MTHATAPTNTHPLRTWVAKSISSTATPTSAAASSRTPT